MKEESAISISAHPSDVLRWALGPFIHSLEDGWPRLNVVMTLRTNTYGWYSWNESQKWRALENALDVWNVWNVLITFQLVLVTYLTRDSLSRTFASRTNRWERFFIIFSQNSFAVWCAPWWDVSRYHLVGVTWNIQTRRKGRVASLSIEKASEREPKTEKSPIDKKNKK